MADEKASDPYKQFYETWARTWSDVFEKTMRSPEFLTALAKSFQGSLGVKEMIDQAMETTLKSMRMPTASDIHALARRLTSIEEKLERLAAKREAARPRSKPRARARR